MHSRPARCPSNTHPQTHRRSHTSTYPCSHRTARSSSCLKAQTALPSLNSCTAWHTQSLGSNRRTSHIHRRTNSGQPFPHTTRRIAQQTLQQCGRAEPDKTVPLPSRYTCFATRSPDSSHRWQYTSHRTSSGLPSLHNGLRIGVLRGRWG